MSFLLIDQKQSFNPSNTVAVNVTSMWLKTRQKSTLATWYYVCPAESESQQFSLLKTASNDRFCKQNSILLLMTSWQPHFCWWWCHSSLTNPQFETNYSEVNIYVFVLAPVYWAVSGFGSSTRIFYKFIRYNFFFLILFFFFYKSNM